MVLGGGTPKNFINQASVQAEFYSPDVGGHRFALQIVTDVPHFGGASGSSLEEAQSWGKLSTESAKVIGPGRRDHRAAAAGQRARVHGCRRSSRGAGSRCSRLRRGS